MTIIFTWKSCHSTKNYISSSTVFEKGDFPKGSYYYADIPCIIQKDGISFSQKYFSPFYIEDEELSSKKPHGNISIHVWSVKLVFLFSVSATLCFWSDNFIFSHKDDTFCIFHLSRYSFLEIWSYFRLQDSSKGRVFLSVVKQCTIEVLSIFVL